MNKYQNFIKKTAKQHQKSRRELKHILHASILTGFLSYEFSQIIWFSHLTGQFQPYASD